MANKNKPTDLPGADLLFGGHSTKSEPAPNKPVEIPATQNKENFAFNVAHTDETEPVKFTFYFTPRLLEELEVAKFRLRMEKRLKVTKSDIVNAALEYALKDINFLERMVSGKLN